ncbi:MULTISPECIES: AAA family ATPase [Mesonia]|uniref:5-methylcytosine-specific restriction enzyme B n=1 Tax=Mesonia oceanica TaxID=2687242 RepID=A0AC61Y9A1_9FLAO|nr:MULTISPECIES: AAA family ATPase [Mesonia]VVV00458.1 5-methylcytosine-specific restriction enzyme B [Mesonia oceanica]|tara:strand:- start:12427 stop:14322 length:1896 start_codon:yes stop_codon:yes gene_type:complete
MNYWAVGSSFGGTDDRTQEFIKNENWFDGKYDQGDHINENYLKDIRVGDILVMKSSATKGKGHSITFTKVKAIGIVNELLNTHYYKVMWLSNLNELPLDFDGISYRKIIEPLRNDKIKEYVDKALERMQMIKTVELLNYKKQIILQGPPGTGKTYLAKKIANELTKDTIKFNALHKIEVFFENYKVNDDILEHREFVNGLNKAFLNKFEKQELSNLKLDDYVLGIESNDTFCYWLEYKLVHTGKYAGRATKGKIYWDAKNEEYKKNGFIRDIEDNSEAMKKVAKLLEDIVYENVYDYPIGKGFVLKVLYQYHPDKYFPINSEFCLNNVLRLIKQEYKNLNYIEKNKKVQQFFLDLKHKYNSDITNYELMYFLFENFDLKGKLILENDEVVTKGDKKIIQFHPSYTYEDFVRGITINTNESGRLEYEPENKSLAKFAEDALNNKTANYVLIIDEINRANLPSVLGELIYALEYRGDAVESMYAIEEDNKITIPPNLYIIGTMNTADRSVGHIDYAIRRRFAFVDVLPDEGVIANAKAKKLFEEVSKLFVESVDGKKKNSKYLTADFDYKDIQLGHSYFLLKEYKEDDNKDEKQLNELKMRLKYEIKPILLEYVKDGILQEDAKENINDLKVV